MLRGPNGPELSQVSQKEGQKRSQSHQNLQFSCKKFDFSDLLGEFFWIPREYATEFLSKSLIEKYIGLRKYRNLVTNTNSSKIKKFR